MIHFTFLTFFAFLLTTLTSTASAGLAPTGDPDWSYKTIHTPHFEVIFRKEQKKLGHRYALAAEQAYALLGPYFSEFPNRTIIYLADHTDISNGLATFLPYPIIQVFPVLPDSSDSIGDYGDWALEMILHEYTHILNMEPAHGFYRPLSWIFGGVIRPNALLPRWYLEGLAVDLESELSAHGRLRAKSTRAESRAITLDNSWDQESVARMNETGISTWPHGARPYLFGGWWWQTARQNKDLHFIDDWNQRFSRRIPFLLNGPVRDQLGQSVPDIFQQMIAGQRLAAESDFTLLKKAETTQASPLFKEDGEQEVFAISPSGIKLIYWQREAERASRAILRERESGSEPFNETKAITLFKSSGTSRVEWVDENRIVFDQIDTTNPLVNFRDLYIYDLQNKKLERLTREQRAHDACPSPDASLIVFVQNSGGQTHLALLDLKTLESKILVSGNLYQRLANPLFIDSTHILFSVRQKSGSEKTFLYDLTQRRSRPYKTDFNSVSSLRRHLRNIFVIDGKSGTSNAYRLTKNETIALTNTLTEIRSVDFDPLRNELLVSELTSQGPKIKSVPAKEHFPISLTKDQSALNGTSPPTPPTISEQDWVESDYHPISYLLPRYWIPMVYQAEGGLIFQGLTSNQDPVGRHQYSLMAAFDTITMKPSFGVSYLNNSFPTQLGLDWSKTVSYLGASDLTVEDQSASGRLINLWPMNSRFSRWSLGGEWHETTGFTDPLRRFGPNFTWFYSRMDNPLDDWFGYHLEIGHQEYLSQDGYLDYGRSTAVLAARAGFADGHRLTFNGRTSLSPNLPLGNVVALGDRSVGGNYLVNLVNSQFLLRGYPSGTFIGREVLNGTIEYALPPLNIDGGLGTFPIFLKNLELAAFFDSISVDGGAFSQDLGGYSRSRLGEFYSGTGLELRVNTTTGYHLPLTATIGLYYGFNDRFGGGLSPFLGIGFGGLSGLEHKTP